MKRKRTVSRLKENLSKLPPVCLAVNETEGKLIAIHRGQSGYHDVDRQLAPRKPSTMTREEWADLRNLRLGVTKQQQQAMVHGSMWGWETGGADPDIYDIFGRLQKL